MNKKIIGAVISALIIILIFESIFLFVLNDVILSYDLLFVLIIIGSIILGVAISLIGRIKEIKSGEEEESKKY